jgi:putative transposase
MTVAVFIKIFAAANFIKKYKDRLSINFNNIQKVAVNHIKKINKHIPLATIFKLLQLDAKTYYRWRSNATCKVAAIGQCIIKHPTQLLAKEVEQIKQYTTDIKYLHWSLASVYHQMKRDGFANYYITTFYKYCKALKIQRLIPKHRRKNKHTGIRAELPLQLLHIDVTIFKCMDNTKAYIYVIKDNCSKAILHCTAQLTLKAEYTIQALQQVYEQYKNILPHTVQLMTDNGSENSSIKNWITNGNLTTQLQHIIAQIDTHFSNSMVEAGNRSLKYYGLYKQDIANFTTLQKILPLIHYDHLHKPLNDLDGLTPHEKLHNLPYPEKPTHTKTINRDARINQNKQLQCCNGLTF